jgi:FkbM family methyltransferase
MARTAFLDRVREGTYHWEDVPVCLCGSAASVPIAARDRFDIPVGFVVCTACGLMRTTPRLAARDLPMFYDTDYHALHMGIEAPSPNTALYRPGQGIEIYEYMRPFLPAGTLYIAEIGAGTGQVLREFGRAAEAAGHEVTLIGCEYARSFVAAGREAGTDLLEGGVDALAGGAPPDVFIMSHVLEHFADPTAELQQIWRIARPGTLVYVEVPGLMTLHAKTEYEFELSQYLTLAHTYHFTLSTLIDAMARAGFRLLTGDEVVRAVFVREDEATVQLDGHEGGASQLLDYLRRVDRSPVFWARRFKLRAGRRIGATTRRLIRVLLGKRGIAIAKRLRGELRGAVGGIRTTLRTAWALRREFGLVRGTLMATERARNRPAVRFVDRGRRYWMVNDQALVYHLMNSIQPIRRLADYVVPVHTEIVDVGAHCGLFAAFAADRAPAAHITIIEPDPKLAPIIRANLRNHRAWRLIGKAATNRDGTARFFRNELSTQTSSLLPEAVKPFGGATSELEVEVVRLDTLLAGLARIDVLKVDVQGAEGLVVEGARQILPRVQTLLIEITVLDQSAERLIESLTTEFGPPEQVNVVAGGADFAFRRSDQQGSEEHRHPT